MKSVWPPRGDGSLTAVPAAAGMGERGPIRIQHVKSPGGGSGGVRGVLLKGVRLRK